MSLKRMAVQEVCIMVGNHEPWPAIGHPTSEWHNDDDAPGDHTMDRGTANVDLLSRAGHKQARGFRKKCRKAIVSQGIPSKPVLWPLRRVVHANSAELALPSAIRLVCRSRLLGPSTRLAKSLRPRPIDMPTDRKLASLWHMP